MIKTCCLLIAAKTRPGIWFQLAPLRGTFIVIGLKALAAIFTLSYLSYIKDSHVTKTENAK